tara:strand:+ start:256 stop:444 length:189 start_codon:yes stop_codon:yes gene_type:complete
MSKKKKKIELYEIILYSMENKVKSLAKGLSLQEAKDFMEAFKVERGTMIGLIPYKEFKNGKL